MYISLAKLLQMKLQILDDKNLQSFELWNRQIRQPP